MLPVVPGYVVEVQVALKLINSQDLRDPPKVYNGGHKLTVVVVLSEKFLR